MGLYYLSRVSLGRVAEWFKAHAWKACGGHKPLAGSNPALSVYTVPPDPLSVNGEGESLCLNQAIPLSIHNPYMLMEAPNLI